MLQSASVSGRSLIIKRINLCENENYEKKKLFEYVINGGKNPRIIQTNRFFIKLDIGKGSQLGLAIN